VRISLRRMRFVDNFVVSITAVLSTAICFGCTSKDCFCVPGSCLDGSHIGFLIVVWNG
jgi:hypothetical protein